MLVDATYVAINNTYVDRLKHSLLDSLTLSTSTSSTKLEQLTSYIASKMFYYKTLHFLDYLRKYTEV